VVGVGVWREASERAEYRLMSAIAERQWTSVQTGANRAGGIVGFLLFLFLLSCVFDPADKVLNLKVWLFMLCWLVTLIAYLLSRRQPSIPRALLIYTVLFVLIPVFSIVWYWVIDGSSRYEGFGMLKGYVLIALAPLLVLNGIDLLPRLCAVLTVLAIGVIGVFVAVQMIPGLDLALYVLGESTGVLYVGNRDYGSDVKLLQVYFVTSPMLAISIAYYLSRAQSATSGNALRFWALTAINMLGMLLAGTRNNIFVSILLPAALIFFYMRSKAVGAIFGLAAVFALTATFASELRAFFDPLEASNSTKLAMLQEYSDILSDPVNLVFGRGLGAYEYWQGRGFKQVTELTYLELVRNFGLFGAIIMLGLLLFPIWHAFAAGRSQSIKAIAIGFVFYLVMCVSNPNLFSSMGILILSVMLANVFLPSGAWYWLSTSPLASLDLARSAPIRD
jgi:hypothetical protein